jgi:hypothetical protein
MLAGVQKNGFYIIYVSWRAQTRALAFMDFFLASRAKYAIISGPTDKRDCGTRWVLYIYKIYINILRDACKCFYGTRLGYIYIIY